MLQAIRKANPGSDFIYVVDTRPKVSVLPFLPIARLNLSWMCLRRFLAQTAGTVAPVYLHMLNQDLSGMF